MRLGRMWRMRGKKEQFPTKGLNKKKKKQTKDGHPREKKTRNLHEEEFFSSLVTAYIQSSSNLSMDVSMYFTYVQHSVYFISMESRGKRSWEGDSERQRKRRKSKKYFLPFFYRYFLEVAGCVYVYIFHVSSRPEKVSNWAGQRPGRQ